MALMFIMRGIPSSGKSTTARKIAARLTDAVICSADHYFGNTPEEYKANFHGSKLAAAHAACRELAEKTMMQGKTVIVDNCNVKREHYAEYIALAIKYGYTPLIIESAWSEWRNRIKPAILGYQLNQGGGVPYSSSRRELALEVAQECAKRNDATHGCPSVTILKMMREYEV